MGSLLLANITSILINPSAPSARFHSSPLDSPPPPKREARLRSHWWRSRAFGWQTTCSEAEEKEAFEAVGAHQVGTTTTYKMANCNTLQNFACVFCSGAVPRLSSVSAFSSETAVALGMRWWTSAGSASTDSIESLLGP